MVKYHVKTPHGMVTRTSRRQLEPQFTHVVVYNKHMGVPGSSSKGQVPTFHGRSDLAQSRAAEWNQQEKGIHHTRRTGTAEVFPITESDYTVK